MKGDPDFVILKYSAWLDASKFEDKILGAIVRQFLKPTNAYVPESPLQYNDEELVEGSLTDFVLDNTSSADQSASLSLQSVAGFSFNGNTTDSVHLSGKLIRYKRLQQHDQFWAKLKDDANVSSRVPGWISIFNTWPVCLVVGVMVCDDVEVSLEGKQTLESEGHVEIPIGTITLAAGIPNPLGEAGQPQGNLSINKSVATIFKAKSGQSKIFALELRKVTTELLRRKELVLKDNGPDVGDGRLLGDDEDEMGDESVTVADLILEKLSPEEFAEMAG